MEKEERRESEEGERGRWRERRREKGERKGDGKGGRESGRREEAELWSSS